MARIALALLLIAAPPLEALAGAYSDQVIADGPVAYWRLGETSGTTAVDEMSAYNGAYNGPTLNQTSLLSSDTNKAASFDGVNDYVDCGTPAPSGTGLTIVAWVKPTTFNFVYGTLVSKASFPSKTIVLVTPNATTLPAQDAAKKALLEGWGYKVVPLLSTSSQAAYDAAVAVANGVYISEQITSADVGTKLKSATVGVVSDEPALSDDFAMASTKTDTTQNVMTTLVTTHYITSTQSVNPSTIFTSAQPASYFGGTIGSGVVSLAQWASNPCLIVVDAGGTLYDSTTAAGRRVILPWGGNNFDINTLTTDGKALMRRAIEWATAPRLLFIVTSSSSPTTQETNRKNAFDGFGYRTTMLTATSTQSAYNAAVAACDVVYISEQITAADVGTKLDTATVGIVNEEGNLDSNYGFSSTFGSSSVTSMTISTNKHYITSANSTGSLTVFSSSQPVSYQSGTMAPGLITLSQFGANVGLTTLEPGAPTQSGGTAPARRVESFLAGNAFDFTVLNSAAKALNKRIIDWAAAKPVPYWTLSTAPYNSGTNVRFVLQTSGGTTTLTASTNALSTSTTTMLVATYDGSNMRLYKDGTQIASVAKTGTVQNGSSVPVWIGNSTDAAADTAWGNPFNGVIDEVALFSRALSAAEISALFTKGSKGGVHITKWLETQ